MPEPERSSSRPAPIRRRGQTLKACCRGCAAAGRGSGSHPRPRARFPARPARRPASAAPPSGCAHPAPGPAHRSSRDRPGRRPAACHSRSRSRPVNGSTDSMGRKFSTSSEACQMYLFTSTVVLGLSEFENRSQIVARRWRVVAGGGHCIASASVRRPGARSPPARCRSGMAHRHGIVTGRRTGRRRRRRPGPSGRPQEARLLPVDARSCGPPVHLRLSSRAFGAKQGLFSPLRAGAARALRPSCRTCCRRRPARYSHCGKAAPSPASFRTAARASHCNLGPQEGNRGIPSSDSPELGSTF